jgi:hypothetical protein
MSGLFLLALSTVLLVPVFFRLRKTYRRRKYPRDYAYHLFQQAKRTDHYAYLKSKIPRLTATRYSRLVMEFRAVDASLTNIAQRQVGEPFSSKPVLLALQQLHPFLKYEGLRQAIRVARSRHSDLEKAKNEIPGMGTISSASQTGRQ